MPVIGIESYKIDFSILEDNNPDTLIVLDKSNYLDLPQKPLLDVTLPGFTGYIEVPYKTGGISVYNSDAFNLTVPQDGDCIAPLPDGVYTLTMKICPYDEFFTTRYHLKSSTFNIAYQELLLKYEDNDSCWAQKELQQMIMDIDILIQSAKAEVNRGNVQRATDKYKAAVKKLTSVNNKLNCN